MVRNNSGLVYSSEHGKMCPDCNQPVTKCSCKKNKPQPSQAKNDGIVRIQRETKGRKGKGVTLITGIPLDDAALKSFAKKLKQRCGAGGAVKDGVVEIQGDHRDMLLDELTKEGWTVKKAGG